MQLVFRALADPTRRAVIELLTVSPRSIQDICSEFDVSRNAVVKHLRILEEAEIVISRPVGRERVHHLQAKALERAANWLNHFEKFWDDKLDNLKHAVEADYHEHTNDT